MFNPNDFNEDEFKVGVECRRAKAAVGQCVTLGQPHQGMSVLCAAVDAVLLSCYSNKFIKYSF